MAVVWRFAPRSAAARETELVGEYELPFPPVLERPGTADRRRLRRRGTSDADDSVKRSTTDVAATLKPTPGRSSSLQGEVLRDISYCGRPTITQ